MTRSTLLKQSLQNWNKGFTLIELLIGGVVSLMVISVTLGLIVEQRRLFLGDQSKIDYNQNLRAASDLMGTDIKQVGERIASSSPLPVVRLVAGASADDPDALILQRQLIEDTLSLCADIAAGDTEIVVADVGAGCNFSDGDSDNLDDSLGQFKGYRCDLSSAKTTCNRGEDDLTSTAIANEADCDNECVYGFIYDATNNRGEFFLYTDETYAENGLGLTSTNSLQVIPLGSGNDFENTYDSDHDITLYILEEKKYALCDGVFQLNINRQPSYDSDCPYPEVEPQPIRLVDGIDNFQVRIQTDSGWVTTYNENLASITDFSELNSVEITLVTETNELLETEGDQLSLTTNFFPRNALSDF